MHIVCLWLGCSLSAGVGAGVDEFGRARIIAVDPARPVQRLILPQDVYEWSTRDDLGDVRVLNGSGAEVPYALRRPVSRTEARAAQSLPVFPLPAQQISAESGAVNIELGKGGTVIAVHGAGTVAPTEGQTRYLLDASGYSDRVSELEFAWPPEAPQFVAGITVEGSNDLTTWRTLAANATLASLTTEGHAVSVNRVRLREERNRYLRITQSSGPTALVVTAATARSDATQLHPPSWKRLEGTSVDDAVEFVTDGRFPIDRAMLQRPGSVFLQDLAILSRATDEDRWTTRAKQTFYRVDVNDEQVESPPATFGATTDRLWRIEATSGAVASGDELRVGWLPHELIFVAQGDPPFSLVYGQAGLSAVTWPITELAKRLDADADLDTLPVAPLADPVDTGGRDRLKPPPKPLDWRTIGLWGVLIVGVGLVALLAVRLVRKQGGTA